ncbi:MAG: CPBP family intramembrane metalloprotease [Pirellulales bacterium]|nr:CPBP family intramembrane metalloprotease [Pirellulales bacterium]
MNTANVKLILSREIRDQLRDRRTLFMMFVLPILLYPLLGMSFVQIQQFTQEKPTTVLVVGANHLTDLPRLFENGRFAPELFSDPSRAKLLELHFPPDDPSKTLAEQRAEAQRAVQAGQYDVAICFPETFAEEAERFERTIRDVNARQEEDPDAGPAAAGVKHPPICEPETFYTTANDKSNIAQSRLDEVWNHWNQQRIETNLAAAGLPVEAVRPVELRRSDVADETPYRGAALWSKILPVLLLIWALTGAFYPAVDLCAGEKERGTLETLLSSPAERSEIVLGKLLTIMLFSMVTAALNIASVGLTGWLVFGRLPEFGPPPPAAIVWLAVALVPVSALFSALCLALAAFARSTKEGQYYLMPLLIITMPLAVMPMAPGVELTLGNSLIPVTGVVLLLRSVLEGGYWQALQFLPVVVAVTLAACLLAIRWAVEQFNSESVLFRESERLDVGLWLQHLVRDRQPTPTAMEALFCAALILLIRFFIGSSMQSPEDLAGFAKLAIVTQLVVIAAPPLLMTIVLTGSPRETLLLKPPRGMMAVPAAIVLALLLHPVVNVLQIAVQSLYPINEDVLQALKGVETMLRGAPLWKLMLVVAVMPAICEELAFRGFILSGFRHLGHKWRAIVYSAVCFGFAHAVLQQSLMAFLVGVVIGFVAVQTGSIVPGMVFHLVHNCLPLAVGRISPEQYERWPGVRHLMSPVEGGGYLFDWPTVVVAGLLAAGLLVWFGRLKYPKSEEEELRKTIERR